MMDDTFFQEWMVLCQHRIPAQDPCGLPHDQPDETKRDAEVKQVQRYPVRRNRRHHYLIKVQPMPEHQNYGHKSYGAPISLGVPLHIDEEWSHEIDYQVQPKDARISSVEPALEVDRLLRNIRIPDQHELIEPDIGIKDRERELIFSQIMQMLLVRVLEISLVLQIDHEEGYKRDPGDEGPRKHIPADHRRKPVRLQAHQPEPGKDGRDGQRKKHYKDRGPDRIGENEPFALRHRQFRIVDRSRKVPHLFAQQDP